MPQVTVVVEHAGLLITLRGDYSAGRPECQYLPNGDPGYPADPAEFEACSATLADGTDLYGLLAGTFFKLKGTSLACYMPVLTMLEHQALELLKGAGRVT